MGHRTTLKSLERMKDKEKIMGVGEKYHKLLKTKGIPAETRTLFREILERAKERYEEVEDAEEEEKEPEKKTEKEKS